MAEIVRLSACRGSKSVDARTISSPTRQPAEFRTSIEVLPEIVDTVGSKMEIMFDGGIRTGMDVMRALALGAKSCMIGRAYAYGLGAGGQEGVAKAIDILAKELTTTMGLCGVNTIAEIDDNVLAI